ncbi:MAG: ATP-grasp domain-containing protein [Acidobacteria bacterium]|nr:ATP-grasp domain-containing protein [Acidobacteriota bacterium]
MSARSDGGETRGRRLLLLCTTTGYQTRAFAEAAAGAGVEVVFGTDRCKVLEDPWGDGALALRFEDARWSAGVIVDYARANPLDGVVAVGDRPTPTAAWACQALGFLHNSPEAAEACRDKYQSRERLRAAGLRVPTFRRFQVDDDPQAIAAEVEFPCVLKPLALSASRGVIRADTREEFVAAFERIRALLRSREVQVLREETSNFIQVERFIPGREVALEGLLDRGRLKVLALFDKPDPLDGPFFEETLYVTPSRLPAETQKEIVAAVGQACKALGLSHGPLHAELRLNREGPWVLEVAARSIGGLCARALRFEGGTSLEELIIRQALGEDVSGSAREGAAAGVMMIPIAQAGIYEGVEGVRAAEETPGVEEVIITAKAEQKLVPLPEGASYLGFIFARAASPELVESALRAAHAKLRFRIRTELPVISSRSAG